MCLLYTLIIVYVKLFWVAPKEGWPAGQGAVCCSALRCPLRPYLEFSIQGWGSQHKKGVQLLKQKGEQLCMCSYSDRTRENDVKL